MRLLLCLTSMLLFTPPALGDDAEPQPQFVYNPKLFAPATVCPPSAEAGCSACPACPAGVACPGSFPPEPAPIHTGNAHEITTCFIHLQHGCAERVAAKVSAALKREHNLEATTDGLVVNSPVVIVPHTATNSLVVMAEEQYLDETKVLIAHHDVEPRQFKVRLKMTAVHGDGKDVKQIITPLISTVEGTPAKIQMTNETAGSYQFEIEVAEAGEINASPSSAEEQQASRMMSAPGCESGECPLIMQARIMRLLFGAAAEGDENACCSQKAAAATCTCAESGVASCACKNCACKECACCKCPGQSAACEASACAGSSCESSACAADSSACTAPAPVACACTGEKQLRCAPAPLQAAEAPAIDSGHNDGPTLLQLKLRSMLHPEWQSLSDTSDCEDAACESRRIRLAGHRALSTDEDAAEPVAKDAAARLVLMVYPVADIVSGNEPLLSKPQLINLIKHTIEPETWDTKGGEGGIDAFEATHSLVIRQNAETHKTIGKLIDQLDRVSQLRMGVADDAEDLQPKRPRESYLRESNILVPPGSGLEIVH